MQKAKIKQIADYLEDLEEGLVEWDYRGISHWRQKRVTKRTQSQEKKVAIAKMEL